MLDIGAEAPKRAWRADGAFGVALLFSVVAKLLFDHFTRLELSPDEAHYWLWSRRLDLAYYSKGPLVALGIRASTELFGDSAWAIRLPALACAVLFFVVLYRWMRELHGPRAAWLAGSLLLSTPFFFSLGAGMTTDAPCLLGWVLGWRAAQRALSRGEPRQWIAAGAFFGFAMLAKYTAGIAPVAIAVYLLLDRRARPELRRRELWIGVALLVGSMAPVALWNAEHGWVNLAHNASHLSVRAGDGASPLHLLELLGAQLGLLGPLAFPLLLWAGGRGLGHVRRGRDPLHGLLLASVLPLAVLCLAISLTRSVYGNWPAPLYVGLTVLLAGEFARARGVSGVFLHGRRRRAIRLNLALLALATPLVLGATGGLPASMIPLRKMMGWEELGAEVARRLAAHPEASFVLANRWHTASALEYHTPGHPTVLNGDWGPRRMNQYDIWQDFADHRGQTGLLVYWRAELPPDVTTRFEEVVPVGEAFTPRIHGQPLETRYFFLGHGYDGRSFGDIVGR